MFSEYDDCQDPSSTNDNCAEGQRMTGMEQFSLPMYDAWQSSIDFMLWPPGSCEYGCHVATCSNMHTQTEPNDDPKSLDIPRSPWSTAVPTHTVNNMSYYKPCGAQLNRDTCHQQNIAPKNNRFNEQTSTFRTKDIPMTTPVWRPNGPTPRFSEKL